MPQKEIPSIIQTELEDQKRLQSLWGEKEYEQSIYKIPFGEGTVSFMPFERIPQNHGSQLIAFREYLSEEHQDLAVIEYLSSTHKGRIESRAGNYYDQFEKICIQRHLSTADFDLVRNDSGNLIYLGIASSTAIPIVINTWKVFQKTEITRREFFKFVITTVLFSAPFVFIKQFTGNQTQSMPPFLLGNLYRTANIAQNIVNYIEKNKGAKVVVLYPPVHAAYIRYFMEHPVTRSLFYNQCKRIFPKSAFEPIIKNN